MAVTMSGPYALAAAARYPASPKRARSSATIGSDASLSCSAQAM